MRKQLLILSLVILIQAGLPVLTFAQESGHQMKKSEISKTGFETPNLPGKRAAICKRSGQLRRVFVRLKGNSGIASYVTQICQLNKKTKKRVWVNTQIETSVRYELPSFTFVDDSGATRSLEATTTCELVFDTEVIYTTVGYAELDFSFLCDFSLRNLDTRYAVGGFQNYFYFGIPLLIDLGFSDSKKTSKVIGIDRFKRFSSYGFPIPPGSIASKNNFLYDENAATTLSEAYCRSSDLFWSRSCDAVGEGLPYRWIETYSLAGEVDAIEQFRDGLFNADTPNPLLNFPLLYNDGRGCVVIGDSPMATQIRSVQSSIKIKEFRDDQDERKLKEVEENGTSCTAILRWMFKNLTHPWGKKKP